MKKTPRIFGMLLFLFFIHAIKAVDTNRTCTRLTCPVNTCVKQKIQTVKNVTDDLKKTIAEQGKVLTEQGNRIAEQRNITTQCKSITDDLRKNIAEQGNIIAQLIARQEGTNVNITFQIQELYQYLHLQLNG
ncbi:unnamed protein product, partial [Owenia fusiformis]